MAHADRDALLHSRRGASGSAKDGSISKATPDDDDDDAGLSCSASMESPRALAGRRESSPPSGSGVTRRGRGGRSVDAAPQCTASVDSFAAENDADAVGDGVGRVFSESTSPLAVSRATFEPPRTSELPGVCESNDLRGESPIPRQLSKVEVAAYQAVAVEEFAMQAREVREILGLHPTGNRASTSRTSGTCIGLSSPASVVASDFGHEAPRLLQ